MSRTNSGQLAQGQLTQDQSSQAQPSLYQDQIPQDAKDMAREIYRKKWTHRTRPLIRTFPCEKTFKAIIYLRNGPSKSKPQSEELQFKVAMSPVGVQKPEDCIGFLEYTERQIDYWRKDLDKIVTQLRAMEAELRNAYNQSGDFYKCQEITVIRSKHDKH